jgi:hypothetical protein
MRLRRLIPVVCILSVSMLSVSAPAFAQSWIEYTSLEDRFSVNFPGEPTVEDTTYTSQYEADYPARVHTRVNGESRYSITVVDHTNAAEIFKARAADCPPDAQSDCSEGYWTVDIYAAPNRAAREFLTRADEVTYFGYSRIDRIGGHQIQLINPDQSRSYVEIHMHENRLYIQEATVPAGAPEPSIFGQSLRLLDVEGRVVRYMTDYANGFPAPARQR